MGSGLKEHPSFFSVPSGYAFADALALGLLRETAGDPLALSDYTILLPTRRACRTLREVFLRLTDGRALLLPRMTALGDVDADDMTLLFADNAALAQALTLPPAIGTLERQLLLARLVQRRDPDQGFDQAAGLAIALGRFLDDVQNEGLGFDRLTGLVPDLYARHWQMTLDFLKVLTEHWPAILSELHVMDAAARRVALMQAQMQAWEKSPPAGKVIAAGTAGSTPAAMDLLCLVARLPQGRVVLAGLDRDLDEESWQQLDTDHPQAQIRALLSRAGIDRGDVVDWPVEGLAPANRARVAWLSEALRPAVTTERWRDLRAGAVAPAALEGLTRIDCATAQEEADIIAMIMRETLETPAKTIALVTPDRRLARRVTQSLRRWGIQIDDSGGQPLSEIMAGSFLLLLVRVAVENLAPVALLSLLKHPLMAGRLPPEELRGLVYLLDQFVLRGPRPRGGIEGLLAAINLLDERRAGDRQRLHNWITTLAADMSPLLDAMQQGQPAEFGNFLRLHILVAETLATTVDETGAARLWRGEGGEAASLLLTDLMTAAGDIPPLAPSQYLSLLGNLFKGVTVRPRYGSHPRLFILGLIEARLYAADKIILGGLNEGTWPALPAHDPWLSRPMRKAFGLPPPEKDLSLAAHDFVQAVSMADVVLTRAAKIDGTPTVPARWLLRMDTVLKAAGLEWPTTNAARYRDWLQKLDAPEAVHPAQRPSPVPPVDARPRELSVTKIETWMRDPYQIYAQYVLGLKSLDPIDDDPGGSERGVFIHAALERFARSFPDDLPDDAQAQLISFGRQALDELSIAPEVAAFWWPRFERLAAAFVEHERKWRASGAKPAALELKGKLAWPDFTLTGKADRIDRLPDGSYAVIDYKTGSAPTKKQVAAGLSPQLPLEALMLQHGAFEGLPAGNTSVMEYWQASGKEGSPVKIEKVTTKDNTADTLREEAAEGLRRLVDTYKNPETAYHSQPRAGILAQGHDYDHLARVREWSVGSEDEDGGDDAGEVAA